MKFWNKKKEPIIRGKHNGQKPQDFMANLLNPNLLKRTITKEKEINQYITLKLENGKTYIYVNGKKFIQCIRLVLNIPKEDVSIYKEIDSIDEAAKLYSKHLFQNRIIGDPRANQILNQNHSITPEQEFWGHCSNIQAWVEHDYDTRILMTNISFPLLRELTKVGDPKARRVYKEEIALRLESGYPSVVEYLLAQGYLVEFNPSEFQTILESTSLIKNISSNPRALFRFLRFCFSKFPSLIEDILSQVLKLPEGKSTILSLIQMKPNPLPRRPAFPFGNFIGRPSPQFLSTLKAKLESLVNRVDEKTAEDILECIQLINAGLENYAINKPHVSQKNYYKESIRDRFILNRMLLNEQIERPKLFPKNNILEQLRRFPSRCSYCGKIIPKGQDFCNWCGHKKDDDDKGFFPYPFIFKPPGGGGGGSMKDAVPVYIKVKSRT